MKNLVYKAKYATYTVNVEISYYEDSNKAILLIDAKDCSPVAIATVNLNNLKDDEVAIKNYSENEGILDFLLDNKIINEYVRTEKRGYVDIPVYRLNLDLLKECENV